MPTVILKYNVSKSCVALHLGKVVEDHDARVELMSPLGERILAKVKKKFRHIDFLLAPSETTGPYFTELASLSGPIPQDVHDAIGAVVEEVTGDPTNLLAIGEAELALLSDDDLTSIHRLSTKRVPDFLSAVMALDEVLVTVDSISGTSRQDVLVWVYRKFEFGGQVFPAWRKGAPAPIGFVIRFRPPTTAGVIVHEAAHLLTGLRDPALLKVNKGHGQPIVDDLHSLLPAMEESECEERVDLALAEASRLARQARGHAGPHAAESDRWKAVFDDTGGFATWCCSGAENWGSASVDNDGFLEFIPEEARDFCLRSVVTSCRSDDASTRTGWACEARRG